MKALSLSLMALIFSSNAFAGFDGVWKLNCEATEVLNSPFEESFTVEEYPEVEVISYSGKLEFGIGSNRPYIAGEDGVVAIQDLSTSKGKKFVVVLEDDTTITVEQRKNKGVLSSSDGSIEAVLKCQ